MPLTDIISELSKQVGYTVLASKPILEISKPIDLSVREMPVNDFLKLVFDNQKIGYRQEGKSIFLYSKVDQGKTRRESNQQGQANEQDEYDEVRGVLLDTLGRAVQGVSIKILSANKRNVLMTSPNFSDGTFLFQRVPKKSIIEFSRIGYEILQLPVKTNFGILVMREKHTDIGEVVVKSGLLDRRKESFTGAAVTVGREELLQNGNKNILQSLKNIDPSFRMVENLDMGSDPNSKPNIVLRGQSNLPDLRGTFDGNPNEPLFVLDGFTTNIQRIYDLDMQRVKSVTILKDAVAKAVYGAMGGNGVVVIETLQPEMGKLRLSYNGNLNIESPDLAGYNLMNAAEKLEWEHNHNMWYANIPAINSFREQIYNSLYQDVHLKGVDTYWLSAPLQNGVGQRHSLSVEGGDQSMRYGASLLYNNITGAMKGSSRNTVTGSTTLSYRLNNLVFRNVMEISQNDAVNSPYGSFSTYTQMNPYWSPYDIDGRLQPVVGFYPEGVPQSAWTLAYNPLYNASLNSIDESKYAQLSNNFSLEWRISPQWRIDGGVGYTYQRQGADKFTPPGHTNFINYTEQNGLISYKGAWTRTEGMSKSLETRLGVNYNYKLGKNLIMLNGTLNMSDIGSRQNITVAEGFGSDNVTDISMGAYYQRGSSPGGSDNKTRSIALLGVLNYTYDDRFIFDASYRRNASSIYGADSRWGGFWSLGAGWNLHNEDFVKNIGFSQFRLRGSAGYTGVQVASFFDIIPTNNYLSGVYDGKRGTILTALPNPDLGWQRNMDYNVGLDITTRGNRFSARIDAYRRIANNLVSSVSAPPSFGFSNYMSNLGRTVNEGLEGSIRYQVFQNYESKSYLNISLSAAHNRNRLTDIADAFRAYNSDVDKDVQNTNKRMSAPVARYYEGQSLSAIWAMKSAGIDPATGYELFYDKNGQVTYVWNTSDLQIVGDTEAKVNGNFNVNLGYKGFVLSMVMSYRIGGSLYNSTLVDKVENITGRTNLDRRILDAWHQVGDHAIYKSPQVGVSVTNEGNLGFTKPTSRFVQSNNELYFSTINLSYDIQSQRLLKRIGMERLRTTFYTNELLRLSSIDIERGTSYPFARNLSLSINATF
jgi:TonB-linked SusC/RagA family outer membrane protein